MNIFFYDALGSSNYKVSIKVAQISVYFSVSLYNEELSALLFSDDRNGSLNCYLFLNYDYN